MILYEFLFSFSFSCFLLAVSMTVERLPTSSCNKVYGFDLESFVTDRVHRHTLRVGATILSQLGHYLTEITMIIINNNYICFPVV